jgi:RNA polymerase sigma-70 factor (ECF subfamily)
MEAPRDLMFKARRPAASATRMTGKYGRRPSIDVSGLRRAAFVDLRQEDEALLEELRRGTPEAVKALFDRFHGKIYSLAMSIVKNESDAEEAVQDVFMTVVRKAHTFKGNSALYSWIYRICVNTCLMRLRGKRRHETVSIEEFMPVFTEDGMHASLIDDWSKEVERKALDKELGQVIRNSTKNLSEKYRVVFELSDVDGLPNEETARILGLTVPAVKSRLHRARLYLREELTRYMRDGIAAV